MDKAYDRLNHAFSISERNLGIDRLLDPEGIYSHTYSTFIFVVLVVMHVVSGRKY